MDGYIEALKLTDFGLAVFTVEPLTQKCGTPLYTAPEVIRGSGEEHNASLHAVPY